MRKLYFITGNPNKFAEAKIVLPYIEQLEIDLPEIQELDPKQIIEEKMQAAFKHHSGEFIIEDQSFCMDCMNGLPGPLIKWFLKSIGPDGIANIAEKLGNNKGYVSTIFGYAKSPSEIHYFEGRVDGTIVKPRGKGGFGWDPIFLPEGSGQTFGEWKETNIGPNAMRLEALNKLKEFLS